MQEEKVGVECDGPSHFLSNTRRENGRTVAKRRLLEALGWKVVNIPYFDKMLMESKSFVEKWEKNGVTKKEAKERYLKAKLKEVGVVLE